MMLELLVREGPAKDMGRGGPLIKSEEGGIIATELSMERIEPEG